MLKPRDNFRYDERFAARQHVALGEVQIADRQHMLVDKQTKQLYVAHGGIRIITIPECLN